MMKMLATCFPTARAETANDLSILTATGATGRTGTARHRPGPYVVKPGFHRARAC